MTFPSSQQSNFQPSVTHSPSDVEPSTPHPWAIHPPPISEPKSSATQPRRAANPQCHLSPHLTSLSEAHDSCDSFWPSLKKNYCSFPSLSLKDDKKELLGKTRSLCSTWVSNQSHSKERKHSELLSCNILSKFLKKEC